MTEPGGVGTPGTEAGRLITDWVERAVVTDPHRRRWVAEQVAAIEAEAARLERERIVRAVEGLPERPYVVGLEWRALIDRDAVLALIDPDQP